MKYITFNPFRSLGIPGARYIKPDHMYKHLEALKAADRILFPNSWQVNCLAYALKKKIFPSLATYHLGYDKVEMTRAFMALCPSKVPKTAIYSNTAVNFEALADDFGLPFVCKEPRSSSGLGVFLIKSPEDFKMYKTGSSTIYVQEYLDIDRDLRVVIIGDKVVSAYWRVKPLGAFHNNISRGGMIDRTGIPDDVVSQVAEISRQLGIDHAGFDVVVTGSGFFLLEFNLFFGTQGIQRHSVDLGKMVHQYLISDVLNRPTPSCPPPRLKVS